MVGTVWYQVLGALWYGPVFGSRWMDAMGYESAEDVEGEDSWTNYALTTVGSLVAAVALAVLVDWVEATTWQTGLAVGLVAGVGYNVVVLAGIGVLLAVW